MKYFKVLLFVLVLAPVSVFATIVNDSYNSDYGDVSASYVANQEADFQTVIASENERYTTLGFLNTSISEVIVTDEIKVNESDVFTRDFDAGIHSVSAEITALNVSTQPAPASTWSMSTALLGLLTVGRRKS
jgi:hypothetical protein